LWVPVGVERTATVARHFYPLSTRRAGQQSDGRPVSNKGVVIDPEWSGTYEVGLNDTKTKERGRWSTLERVEVNSYAWGSHFQNTWSNCYCGALRLFARRIQLRLPTPTTELWPLTLGRRRRSWPWLLDPYPYPILKASAKLPMFHRFHYVWSTYARDGQVCVRRGVSAKRRGFKVIQSRLMVWLPSRIRRLIAQG